jgi:hypothetical protein
LRYGAKDIEIPDLTTYLWNGKNETKGKKCKKPTFKNGEKKKIVGTTTTIRHIFQLSSTLTCMGNDMLPLHLFIQNFPKKLQQHIPSNNLMNNIEAIVGISG